MTQELEITEENFDQYFFDVRKHPIPQPGHQLVSYTAIAELREGPEKKQIIALLRNTEKAHAITQVTRKLLHASELDAIRLPLAIANDLSRGLSEKKVEKKPYKYTVEFFYYADPENVPKNDPHWNVIPLLYVNDKVDTKDGVTIKSRIIPSNQENNGV